MDRNYPMLYLYGDGRKATGDPDEAKVRLSYGKERKDPRSDDADWICSSVSATSYEDSSVGLILAVQHQQLLHQGPMFPMPKPQNR